MKHDTHIVCSCEIHKDKGDLDITWSHLKNAKYGCKYCAGKGKDISDYYDKIDMLITLDSRKKLNADVKHADLNLKQCQRL